MGGLRTKTTLLNTQLGRESGERTVCSLGGPLKTHFFYFFFLPLIQLVSSNFRHSHRKTFSIPQPHRFTLTTPSQDIKLINTLNSIQLSLPPVFLLTTSAKRQWRKKIFFPHSWSGTNCTTVSRSQSSQATSHTPTEAAQRLKISTGPSWTAAIKFGPESAGISRLRQGEIPFIPVPSKKYNSRSRKRSRIEWWR